MILKNRLFSRVEPSRDAKSFYIFCEGKHRKPEYFNYFKEIDSKINVEVVRAEQHDNNSPTGLYEKACTFIVRTDQNPSPKYELLDIDEVWFVIDTDQWGVKIAELREMCCQHSTWQVAQSNPCFEVWLYYHFRDIPPSFEGMEVSKNWKAFVNSIVAGGFDHRKHPLSLKTAVQNAEANFSEKEAVPNLCCTEVFRLGKNIHSLIGETLSKALNNQDFSPSFQKAF